MTSENLIVQTVYGPVRGAKKTSLLGQEYFSFQGIPYGRPPVGELRFKPPVIPEKWTETLDCTEQCAPCYHFDRRLQKNVGSEDSLRINVFTKCMDKTKPLPVMVYIYGGGYTEGTSGTDLYGPDFFVQKDIILVSFNYRVGALGFLCCQSPEDGVPGNAGFKDQNLALRWVRDNIAAFGGDPQRVTPFGHSAGGASVQYHLISDASKNLFQRAIIMSGSTYCSWDLTKQRNWAEKLAKALGWDEQGGESGALKFLRAAKPEDIVDHQEKLLTPQDKQDDVFRAFGPTIEPYPTEGCFIPKDPLEMSREAWGYNIDVMIGGSSDEGLILLQKVKPHPEMLQHPQLFLGTVPADVKLSLEQRMEIAAKLKQQYYPDSEPSYENHRGYVDMMSDRLFWHAMHRSILARASRSIARTYVYWFALDSEFYNHYRIMMVDPKVRGACHADELSYLFSNFTNQVPDAKTFEYWGLQTMVDIFSSFAIKGDPNCEHTAQKQVRWEPVGQTEPTFKCLNITNGRLEFGDYPDAARLKLWDAMYVNDELF